MKRSGRALQHAALLVVCGIAAAYHGWQSWNAFATAGGARGFTEPFRVRPQGLVIADPHPAAREAGLAEGDVVVRVGGQPFAGHATLMRALQLPQPDGSIPVEVRRGSGTRVIALQADRFLAPPARLTVLLLLLAVFMPWFCLLLGALVVFLRPGDPRAWLLLLLLLCFPLLFEMQAAKANLLPPMLAAAAHFYRGFLSASWPMAMFLFGLRFPDPFEFDRRRPWLKWLLAGPLLLMAAVRATTGAMMADAMSTAAVLLPVAEAMAKPALYLGMLGVGLFFASLAHRRFNPQTPADSRRRLALLYVGASVALVPLLLVLLYTLFTRQQLMAEDSVWVVVALLLANLFPLTLAYVIVVQRALDVRVVVRQGLQYLLASRGVRAIQVVLSLAILYGAFTLASNPDANRPARLLYIVAGIGLIAALEAGAGRFRRWLDRRFFRDAYQAEQVLSELSEAVRSMVETRPLLETVSARLSDTLHVPRIAALLPESEVFVPNLAVGYEPKVTLTRDSAMVRELEQRREPLRVYLDDPDCWVYGHGIDERDRTALRELDAQLLMPLLSNNRLVGIFSLGRKLSEEPYSGSDVRLLQTVASQTALALENSRLTAAVAAETARRERLNRELEIAREVQERLFPQTYPAIAGIELAGYCRPALGVGGDYYDFLETDRGLGLAIGDVSGKGVPASLLMAALQASLRGQTLAGIRNLSQLIGNVNRLIFDSTRVNRYATLFFSHFEPGTRRLEYVNAGHNAPMLFRARSGEVERLNDGGPVVGLLGMARYQSGAVTLEKGDLLIGFTDGISEAMNGADEEWGEENLIDTVRCSAALPARELIDEVMKAADAFADGAPQHDDMTLIVMRVHGD